MKENVPNNGDELTRQDNQLKLNIEERIVMPEEAEGGPPREHKDIKPDNELPDEGARKETPVAPKPRASSKGKSRTAPTAANATPIDDDTGRQDQDRREYTPDELLKVVQQIEKTLESKHLEQSASMQKIIDDLDALASMSEGGQGLLDHVKIIAEQFGDKGEALEFFRAMKRTFKERSESVSPKEVIDDLLEKIREIEEIDFLPKLKQKLSSSPSILADMETSPEDKRTSVTDLSVLIGLARQLTPEKLSRITGTKDNNVNINFHKELTTRLNEVEKMLDGLDGSYKGDPVKAKQVLIELLDGFEFSFDENGRNITLNKGLSDIYLNKELVEEDLMPRCFKDLARLIMFTEVDKFKTGGTLELINREGEVVIKNFVGWVRSRYNYQHDTYSDSEIDLFSNINIFKMYRTITFGEMLSDPRYFMDNEEVSYDVFDKRDGKQAKIKKTEYRENKLYQAVKNHLLYEVWLSQMSHNFDAKYRHVMGIENKLPEVLAEIYYDNIFTKYTDRIAKLMRLVSIGESEDDFLRSIDIDKNGDSIETDDFYQGKVGKMFQRAVMAYQYLAEVGSIKGLNYDARTGKNMFDEQLGDRGKLRFYKTVLQELKEIKSDDAVALQEIESIGNLEELKREIAIFIFEKYEMSKKIPIKDEKGRLVYKKGKRGEKKEVEYEEVPTFEAMRQRWERIRREKGNEAAEKEEREFYNKYLGKLNIFSLIEKEMSIVKAVKTGVKKAVAEQVGVEEIRGVQDGSILSVDIQYAINLAETMIYWTGISAKNDTDAIGHDVWSKVINGQFYRERQVEGRSVWGDLTTLYGFKRYGFTFFEGVKVHRKKTGTNELEEVPLLEVFQGGEGDEVNLEKGLSKFEFKTNASRQFAANHILNAFKVFNYLQRDHGLNHEDMLMTDPASGRIVVDKRKADERIWDGLFKALRYQLDLEEIPWDKKVRGWKRERGVVKFESKTLDESFFSEGVRSMNMYDGIEQKVARARMVFGFLLSQDIFAHRHWSSPDGFKKYTSTMLEAIKEYYCQLRPYKVEQIKDGKKIKINRNFFTKKEMDQILARGRGKLSSVYARELGSAVGIGIVSGFFGSFKKIFGYLFK